MLTKYESLLARKSKLIHLHHVHGVFEAKLIKSKKNPTFMQTRWRHNEWRHLATSQHVKYFRDAILYFVLFAVERLQTYVLLNIQHINIQTW